MVYIDIPLLRWPLYMYVTQLINLINVCCHNRLPHVLPSGSTATRGM